MFHWIEDKEFLSNMRRYCSDIINRLVNLINKEGKMQVNMQMVGSGAKKLETQNGNEPIDLDYNLNIIYMNNSIFKTGKDIKEYVKSKFNEVLSKFELNDCDDSKSALTTKTMFFEEGNTTEFSIDLTITKLIDGKWNKLIHQKTGIVQNDEWKWNIIKNSNGIDEKTKFIKENNMWNKLRKGYLDKKNYYLTINDYNHPSYNCYIEVVNEIYNSLIEQKNININNV